ncbi:hypothetical protein lerEdw1_011475, partial [Lerista edwardsae]
RVGGEVPRGRWTGLPAAAEGRALAHGGRRGWSRGAPLKREAEFAGGGGPIRMAEDAAAARDEGEASAGQKEVPEVDVGSGRGRTAGRRTQDGGGLFITFVGCDAVNPESPAGLMQSQA